MRQGFFTRLDFRVGEFFNLFEHPLTAYARRQFGHHQLPLAARHVFNLPARPHFERAAPAAVGIGNIGTVADDLAAARVVRAGHQGQQFLVAGLGVLD